jgi:hypothetical protein
MTVPRARGRAHGPGSVLAGAYVGLIVEHVDLARSKSQDGYSRRQLS